MEQLIPLETKLVKYKHFQYNIEIFSILFTFIELYVIIACIKECIMAQTKETNLQETKEKLKQVANHWIELQELSKSAIYDISDPNINWNKEVKIADIESIDEKTKVEDSKPEKKSEEPPKKPKQKNNILSVIMFIYCKLDSFIYC